ncbi:MAG: hypothetical protein V2A34_12050, partial [Lentisphaerota bacterium]
HDVNFWEDAYGEIQDKILLAPGTFVRARVNVATYRDKTQLKLGRGTDLLFPKAEDSQFMTAGPGVPTRLEKTPLSDLNAALAGKTVLISGTIASVKEPIAGSKAPFEVVLKEGDAEALVVYWDLVAQRLANNKPVVGGQWQVEGVVAVYKDKVQVKVSRADRITLLGTIPSSTPAVEAGNVMAISGITAAMSKQSVTVQGVLGEPVSLRGGVKYPLSDASGKIVLLLWDVKVPGAQREALLAGVKVLVTGVVQDYKGELELIPASAQSIQIQP